MKKCTLKIEKRHREVRKMNPLTNQGYPESISKYYDEINVDAAKNYNRKGIQLSYEAERELQRQRINENRKRQIDVVTLLSDGRLAIKTQNLDIPTTGRLACNFTSPHLMRLFSRGCSEDIWLFECAIGDRHVTIYIKNSKAGDSRYLLERFKAEGCEIYAPSKQLQKEYLSKIWTTVRNVEEREVLIPEEYGWWLDMDGKIKFIDETKIIWRDVEKCAK